MRPVSILRLLAIAALVGGLSLFVAFLGAESASPRGDPPSELPPGPAGPALGPEAERRPTLFSSNASCRPCHREIYEEWQSDQHSRAWFNAPLFPQDPTRTECVSCHASVPILENGLDQPITVRAERFEEGIGCIECHAFEGSARGPRPSQEALCNPTFDERFTSSATCAPCHAPHGSFEEWEASEHRGRTCQDCHMPLVEGRSSVGGPTRMRRSHRHLSARDQEFLTGAVTPSAAVEGGRVVVRIENRGTGHSFPGEISNRSALCRSVVLGPGGGEVLLEREEVMRAPPRQQRADVPTTQIRAGETREYAYDLPAEWAEVRVELSYRFLSIVPSEPAFWQATIEREAR